MKKKIQILRVLFVLFCANYAVFAQAEYPRVVKDFLRINNDSKMIKDAKISLSTEIFQNNGNEDTLRIKVYDTDGYLLSEFSKTDTTIDSRGEYLIRKFNYIYNKNKLLTEKVDSSGNLPVKSYLKYDELYNVTDEEVFIQNKKVKNYSYEYDDLSRLIESEQKDLVNGCKITETYVYDSYNNLVKLKIQNKCDPLEKKPSENSYNYKYDEQYRILEKRTVTSNGSSRTETFTYTNEGKPESSYIIMGPDSYISTKYTYDKDNSVRIVRTESVDGKIKSSDVVIKYDKFGNRLLEEYYDANNKLVYSYRFLYSYY